MQIVDLPIGSIQSPEWNSNQMDATTRQRLLASIQRFGLVVPLVVIPNDEGKATYQVIGGNQRLGVLKECGVQSVPCVVAELDDSEAMLLSQGLNRIAGVDDLGLRSEMLRRVLGQIPEDEVLALLPETSQSLNALASLGHQDMAGYIQNWEDSRAVRLKHLTFQSTPAQLEVIEEALAQVIPRSGDLSPGNPNLRGNALFILCQHYLALIRRQI
jgi:ParB family chromosome partitioning protein